MELNVFDWIETNGGTDWTWYAKRLSGNDTLATGSHQAGPYIPKAVFFRLFPTLDNSPLLNPRITVAVSIDSHDRSHRVDAIWYNNKIVSGGTRDETRITGWGGASSPILDPEATGSICVFAFRQADEASDSDQCHVWLCSTVEEEDAVEGLVGQIDPSRWIVRRAGEHFQMGLPTGPSSCVIAPEDLPKPWQAAFPRGDVLVLEAVARRGDLIGEVSDKRLLGRRECEYEIFRSIEDFHVLPKVAGGFGSVDSFIDYAHSVSNRRKSRTGRSLELHAKSIFDEDGLAYGYQVTTEPRKKPDFIFPSIEAYRDKSYPREKLVMLGAKTTCKERWTQILDEAAEIPTKHLLTVQEGLSESQFQKMVDAQVVLVVPQALHTKYPASVRPNLLSVEQFIAHCQSVMA